MHRRGVEKEKKKDKKSQKMRSCPESNRGCRNVLRRIRIRSDNRYTTQPCFTTFVIG